MIYRIDPTECPFTTGIDKTKASAVNHEWQTQSLAAPASNAQLEGDDAAADTTTPTARKANICQISRKTAFVSGTQQAVEHAGRDDEMAYQEMLKGLELKRDMERILIGLNQKKVTGDTTTARKTGAVLSWLKTNTSVGATGSNPGTSDGGTSRTDGTTRAFTEALLKTVLAAAWNSGGKPDTIMVNSFNKQQFSTFTGRASPIEDTKAKKITASVDAYESDFGTLKVVPNRFQRCTGLSDTVSEAFILQMEMWGLAFLPGRKMVSIPLSKTGDSEKRSIISEYVLESRNEAASGLVADLTVA
jgi:hypothetical protein